MSLTPPFDDDALYANPLLLRLAELFFDDRFLLDSYVAVQSLPGAQKQRPHRDVPPLFKNIELSQQLPCYAITMIIPLVDIDVQCGTTALWPGSHRDMMKKHAQVDEPVLPVIPRGSVYLWDYRLVHAGTENYADYNRPILSLVYGRSWFSDSENFHKESPIHITQRAYDNIPEHAKFLFDKFKWQIGA
jgi:ectoine hydroxylase-related dioxygenase (phytanoyl-CoA dioxygenase family)